MTNLMTTGFCELNEQEMMETEGGIVVAIIIGVICVGALTGAGVALCSAVNDTRRKSAQTDANISGEPVTVTLLGYKGPTYTATPDPNYKSPLAY